MKYTIYSLMISGAVIATAPSQAGIDTEIHTGFHSIYEFRGVDFGDNLFDAGVDISTKLGGGVTFTAGLWYADTNGNGGGNFDELDYYFGLSKTFGKFELSAGYTYYAFPGDSSSNTNEVYLGLATELPCGTGVSLTYFEDIDEIDGGYLELEVSRGIEVNPCWKIDLSVGAAWSFNYNPDVDGTMLDGFNHWFVKVAMPWEIAEGVTLTPYLKYVAASGNLNNEFGAINSEDLFLGGVSLSYSF